MGSSGVTVNGRAPNIAAQLGGGAKDALTAVGGGIQGAARMAFSAARLDFRGVAAGASRIVEAGAEITKQVVLMSPAGLAANTLLAGKLERGLDKVQDYATDVADVMIASVAGQVESVKRSGLAVARGAIQADLRTVGAGLGGVAMGATSLLPPQLLRTAVAAGVGKVVDDVIPGKAGEVLAAVSRSLVGGASAKAAMVQGGVAALASLRPAERIADIAQKVASSRADTAHAPLPAPALHLLPLAGVSLAALAPPQMFATNASPVDVFAEASDEREAEE